VVEEIVELSFDQRICPTCGKLAGGMTETEDSKLIEVEVRAHRRRIRRKRYRRTCDCPDTLKTLTAPVPAKLIPKGRYGISAKSRSPTDVALGVLGRSHDRHPDRVDTFS